LEVAVPPLAEQIEIAAYLDKKLHDIRQVADTLQQQISVLEAYKKSVVHECVTGKKRVWRGDWQVTSKQGEVI
jgi:type I restriction enzyme S subunit